MMPTPRSHRFRSIVAGVDFSSRSAKALRYAVAMARAGGGRVRAIYVIDTLLVAAAARAYSERRLIAESRDDLERFVRASVGRDLARGVTCTVVSGAPRSRLAEACRRFRADVLVLGTHGRGGFAKAFFGSTTEGLLRRYRGAILAIPARCPDPAEGWPGPSIAAAVPPGGQRRAMVLAATRMADVVGAWLTLTELAAARATPSRGGLTILPLPGTSRLRAFREGTTAYEFLRRARGPVLVVHTGRRVGHVEMPRRVA